MSTAYDEAVEALYQAPHESFVTERQRLSAELKANDDKASAARLAKLGRPTVSAWAVNQLWWHAREAFEELFETAAELRKGKLSASAAHRKALAQLTARAHKLLTVGSHAASEATLRRVSTTLSALAAVGSFEPEQAGALSKDRDPPGFEAFGSASFGEHAAKGTAKHEQPKPKAPRAEHGEHHEHAARDTAEAKRKAAAERQKAEEATEKQRKRQAEARAKKDAERAKREAALREAKAELGTRERAREHAEKALAAATREAERARAAVAAAEAKLAALHDED